MNKLSFAVRMMLLVLLVAWWVVPSYLSSEGQDVAKGSCTCRTLWLKACTGIDCGSACYQYCKDKDKNRTCGEGEEACYKYVSGEIRCNSQKSDTCEPKS